MKETFTPGPWTVQTVKSHTARGTVESVIRGGPIVDGQGEFVTALCYPDKGEEAANARLIAAAPELYAALLQVQADLGDRLTGKTVLMIRAALARARGGEVTPLTRPVRRAVSGRRSYVVILTPAEDWKWGEATIEVREKGRRKGFTVAVEGLYYLLAVRAADLSRSERKAKRKGR